MKQIKTDVLVIGTGIAGLYFSLKCARRGVRVLLTTKDSISITATALAQGGIAAVVKKPDSLRSHMEDTLRTGKGLTSKKVLDHVVKKGRQAVRELEQLGISFDRGDDGKLALGREGGHSFRRIVHVKDKTGEAIENALIKAVRNHPGIQVMENTCAIDLEVGKKKIPCITGAYFTDTGDKKTGQEPLIWFCCAKAVIMATGGLCALYKHTVNPSISTGDGVAMAFRAGALLCDMEFIQFHPTALHKGKSPFFLISEAVRGEGARLVTHDGIPVMKRFGMRDLEARDLVSREIYKVMKKEPVFLTFPHVNKNWLRKRFSGITRECRKWGLDICQEKIPIIPAAHYACGGIQTDIYGKTNIPGLFAIGETASTGLHGANRLASNSLLESIIISQNAAEKIADGLRKKKILPQEEKKDIPVYSLSSPESKLQKMEMELKDILWENAGIVRTVKNMKQGLIRIKEMEKNLLSFSSQGFNLPVHNLSSHILIARLIIQSAFMRKESRGCHFVEDFSLSDKIARHTYISKE